MTVDPGVHANQQANFRVGMGPRPAGWYSAPTRSRAIRSSIAVTGGPSGDVGLWMRVARHWIGLVKSPILVIETVLVSPGLTAAKVPGQPVRTMSPPGPSVR